MNRRLALVALWAVFAVAAVGVGFAAAGLVGDPFTEPSGVQVTANGAGGTPTPTQTATGPAPSTPSGTPSSRHGGSSSSAPPTSSPRSAEPVVRSLSTRAGLVSGSCRGGLVTISAAPAVGWSLDEVSGGPTEEAKAKFRRTGGGEGEVEVHARCASGVPRFTVDDSASGGGSGDSSGSGGRDD